MTTPAAMPPHVEPIGFGAAKLPPGYLVIRSDDHTMWIRLTPDGHDWTDEGCIHWDRWASFRGAWAHYRTEAPDDRQTPAARALAAVRKHPVLAGMKWGKTINGALAETFRCGVYTYGSGQWRVINPATGRVNRFASLDDAVPWLASAVTAFLAACRAVDPEVARLRGEVDRVRDAADILARQLDAERELREQAEEHYRLDSAASAHRREEDREELEAARADEATAYQRGWVDGRDAGAAHLKASAAAWKSTDPDTSRALTRAAAGILTIAPPTREGEKP